MTFGPGLIKQYGVLSKDNKTITLMSFFNHQMDVLRWISEVQLKSMKMQGDPVSCPESPYPVNPNFQGKLVWFSGAPGAGKSTTAQILAQRGGFVYYEADCFMNHCNPYVPLDVPDPSMHQAKQKILKVWF